MTVKGSVARIERRLKIGPDAPSEQLKKQPVDPKTFVESPELSRR